MAEGLAALRRLFEADAGEEDDEGRAGGRGVRAGVAGRGMCRLLADSDDLLFLCLTEALHLHKALLLLPPVGPPHEEGVRGRGGGASGVARGARLQPSAAAAMPAAPGKRKRGEADGEMAGAGCGEGREGAAGACWWFREELSPARVLDGLCDLCGGDSAMLLDLMLSPDNQVPLGEHALAARCPLCACCGLGPS